MSTSVGISHFVYKYIHQNLNFLISLFEHFNLKFSLLKGAFQIQTWPSSSFWNACWWLWHNPNVSGTYVNIYKAGTSSIFLLMVIVVVVVVFFVYFFFQAFEGFKVLISTSVSLSLCPLFGAPAHSSHTKKPKR